MGLPAKRLRHGSSVLVFVLLLAGFTIGSTNASNEGFVSPNARSLRNSQQPQDDDKPHIRRQPQRPRPDLLHNEEHLLEQQQPQQRQRRVWEVQETDSHRAQRLYHAQKRDRRALDQAFHRALKHKKSGKHHKGGGSSKKKGGGTATRQHHRDRTKGATKQAAVPASGSGDQGQMKEGQRAPPVPGGAKTLADYPSHEDDDDDDDDHVAWTVVEETTSQVLHTYQSYYGSDGPPRPFTTTLLVELGHLGALGRPLTNMEERTIQFAMLETYNYLSAYLCDPYHRTISKVQVEPAPAIVSSTDMQFTGYRDVVDPVLYSTTGTLVELTIHGECHGCDPSQVLLFAPEPGRGASLDRPTGRDPIRPGGSSSTSSTTSPVTQAPETNTTMDEGNATTSAPTEPEDLVDIAADATQAPTAATAVTNNNETASPTASVTETNETTAADAAGRAPPPLYTNDARRRWGDMLPRKKHTGSARSHIVKLQKPERLENGAGILAARTAGHGRRELGHRRGHHNGAARGAAINRPPQVVYEEEDDDDDDDDGYAYSSSKSGSKSKSKSKSKSRGYYSKSKSKGSRYKSALPPGTACPKDTGAPTEEEFLDSVNDLLKSLPQAGDASISMDDVAQIRSVECSDTIQGIESVFVVQVEAGNPDDLSDEEVEVLETAVLQSYNELQLVGCDAPAFRTADNVEWTSVAAGDDAGTYLLAFAVTASCRGEDCSQDTMLLSPDDQDTATGGRGRDRRNLQGRPPSLLVSVPVAQEDGRCGCPVEYIEESPFYVFEAQARRGPPSVGDMERVLGDKIAQLRSEGSLDVVVSSSDIIEAPAGTDAGDELPEVTPPGGEEQPPFNTPQVTEDLESFVLIQFFGNQQFVTEQEVSALQQTVLEVYSELQRSAYCDVENHKLSTATLQTVDPGPTEDSFLLGFQVTGNCNGNGCSEGGAFFAPSGQRRELRVTRRDQQVECAVGATPGPPTILAFESAMTEAVSELNNAEVLTNIIISGAAMEIPPEADSEVAMDEEIQAPAAETDGDQPAETEGAAAEGSTFGDAQPADTEAPAAEGGDAETEAPAADAEEGGGDDAGTDAPAAEGEGGGAAAGGATALPEETATDATTPPDGASAETEAPQDAEGGATGTTTAPDGEEAAGTGAPTTPAAGTGRNRRAGWK